MADHTPTPWKVYGAVHVAGKNGNVCTVGQPRAETVVGYTRLDIGSEDSDEAFANADFIVRAANVHDALVEAINWIRKIADMNLEQDEKLRSQGARTLKRIADKCDEVLETAKCVTQPTSRMTRSTAKSKSSR